jgi:hypothetical protein
MIPGGIILRRTRPSYPGPSTRRFGPLVLFDADRSLRRSIRLAYARERMAGRGREVAYRHVIENWTRQSGSVFYAEYAEWMRERC